MVGTLETYLKIIDYCDQNNIRLKARKDLGGLRYSKTQNPEAFSGPDSDVWKLQGLLQTESRKMQEQLKAEDILKIMNQT